MGQRQTSVVREAADSPVAWFAVLERAKAAQDFDRAAQALRELNRLGVKVKYQARADRRAAR